MEFKKNVDKCLGYIHKGLEVYGTAKAIFHTGKAIAGVVGPMLP